MTFRNRLCTTFLVVLGLSLIVPAFHALGTGLNSGSQPATIASQGTTTGATTGPGSVSTVTTVEMMDATGIVLMTPCATITLTGTLMQVTHVTDLGNGYSIMQFKSHPQGIVGVDENGGVYSTGGTLSISGIVPTGQVSVMTTASSFLVTGRGAGVPSIRGLQINHLTVNANGTVTSSVDFESFLCE